MHHVFKGITCRRQFAKDTAREVPSLLSMQATHSSTSDPSIKQSSEVHNKYSRLDFISEDLQANNGSSDENSKRNAKLESVNTFPDFLIELSFTKRERLTIKHFVNFGLLDNVSIKSFAKDGLKSIIIIAAVKTKVVSCADKVASKGLGVPLRMDMLLSRVVFEFKSVNPKLSTNSIKIERQVAGNSDFGGKYGFANIPELSREAKGTERAQEVDRNPVSRSSEQSSDKEFNEFLNLRSRNGKLSYVS